MAISSNLSLQRDSHQIVYNIYPLLLELLDKQADAVVEWDYGSEFLTFSYQWPYRITDHRSGQQMSLEKYTSLIHPDDVDAIRKSFQDYHRSKTPVFSNKVRYIFSETEIVYAELTTAVLEGPHGEPSRMITLIQDYTRMQQANDEIRELTLAIENAMTGIAWLDRNGNFQMVRKDYAALLGYTPEELIGKSYKVTVAEKDLDLAYEAFLQMLKLGKYDINLVARRKDETKFHKNILMIKTFDQSGKHNGHYCLMKDITGQVNYENAIKRKNNDLAHINEVLDTLVYRVSHDLRSPIASSLGLCELMNTTTDFVELEKYIQLQKESLHKLDKLIHSIMDYSLNNHKEVIDQEIDLSKSLSEIIEIQLRNCTIESFLEVKATNVFISDPARFDLIFHHLINNAVRFSDRTKERLIRVECHANEECAIVSVLDNGVGIPEDMGNRIFEMFFRASETSLGSGLGLFIVKEALQKIGGTISYTSRLGEGTTFVVTIPNHLI